MIVEPLFGAVDHVPTQRNVRVVEASVIWNYTAWPNITFLILAGLLVWRFLKAGGPAMLRMMNKSQETAHAH